MELLASKAVVEQELRHARRRDHENNQRSMVLLLRAAPEWQGAREFTFDHDGTEVAVTVVPCPTVLAVLAALGTDREAGRYLVVLTPCDAGEIGESALARVMQGEVRRVNRWDLVQGAFGAAKLDSALLRPGDQWIAEALLDAQPAGGWRRLSGPFLTRPAALNRLAAVRLGVGDAGDGPIDAAALLQWTTDPAAVASFQQLGDTERAGLTGWLKTTAGNVADVVFRIEEPARVADAVPFGLAVAALYATHEQEDGVTAARVRAEERYLGGKALGLDVLRTFGEAAESLITRWTSHGNGQAGRAAALCERADVILGELAGNDENKRLLARRSRVLEAGLDARLAALADTIAGFLSARDRESSGLAAAEAALETASEHGRVRDHEAELNAARSALRLMRWLVTPENAPDTLTDAATRMVRSWGWADRALGAVKWADTSRVPRLADAYGQLWRRVHDRRKSLDEALARKLAAWTRYGSTTDLLSVENVLERVAQPLAAKRNPVIVAVDGMNVAAAITCAEEFTVRGKWLEVGRKPDGREPVLAPVRPAATFPLTGFEGFWGKRKSMLFYQADLSPEPGRPMAIKVRDAIADTDVVVGIAGAATYVRPILDEARRAGRPVILTADRGGVSPDEVVTVAITLVLSESLIPADWFTYDRDGHAPAWWSATPPTRSAPAPEPGPQPVPARRKRQPTSVPSADDALFEVRDVVSSPEPAVSTGAQVVASARMKAQRQLLRRAPSDDSVAALVDALIAGGGRITLQEAAKAVGQPPVRMSGYLAQVTRLLNVDGYPVLQQNANDHTITLTLKYMRQQFLGQL